jgi:hypothetical protein
MLAISSLIDASVAVTASVGTPLRFAECASVSCLRAPRRALDDVMPSPFGYTEIDGCRHLWEGGEVVNIFCEILAFLFDRLTGLQRDTLVAAKPIDLLADPNQPL